MFPPPPRCVSTPRSTLRIFLLVEFKNKLALVVSYMVVDNCPDARYLTRVANEVVNAVDPQAPEKVQTATEAFPQPFTINISLACSCRRP